MAKAPAFQFYVRDWLSDPLLRQASLVSRGIWIDLLCYMWMKPDRDGKFETTPLRLAKMVCGGSINESLHFLNDLWDLEFGDMEFDEKVSFPITEENNNTKITLINRRMYNDYLTRKGGRERQAKFREKGGGDPDKWTAIRIPILERDAYMCAYCGRKADTVDHVFPKSRGGDEDPGNLVACCKRCNMKKNNRTPEEAEMSFWKGFDTKHIKYNTNNNTDQNTKITPSSSSSSSPTKIKKEPFRLPGPETINEAAILKLNTELDKICEELYQSGIFKKAHAFRNKMLKEKKSERAILHTLSRCYLKKKFETTAWAYCTKIIQVEDGNFNERENLKIT